jgi:hypothetical protein
MILFADYFHSKMVNLNDQLLELIHKLCFFTTMKKLIKP